MERIATLTMNPSIDLHTAVERVMPTAKVRCTPACREPGGGGINVARAVRKLGGWALAIYPSGGETGQLLHSLLQEEGVPDQRVSIGGLTRENVSIFERSTGEQYRFVMPGPSMDDGEWRRVLDQVVRLAEDLDFVVASGSLPSGVPVEFYAKLARGLRDTNTQLILDTSGDPLQAALEEGVYLVKPNVRELEQLTSRQLAAAPEREEACRMLVQGGGAQVVALTLEHEGALLMWDKGKLTVPGLAVPVASTVGAGDSFVAGMVLAMARGASLEEAFRRGCASGSAAVMTEGSELCRRSDAESLYERICAEEGRGYQSSAGEN